MSDLLDTTPSPRKKTAKTATRTAKPKAAKPKATKSEAKVAKPRTKAANGNVRPGRAPSARTTKIRNGIMDLLKGKRNGVANTELAAQLKVSAGECLKLARILISEGKVSLSKEGKAVTLKRV